MINSRQINKDQVDNFVKCLELVLVYKELVFLMYYLSLFLPWRSNVLNLFSKLFLLEKLIRRLAMNCFDSQYFLHTNIENLILSPRFSSN